MSRFLALVLSAFGLAAVAAETISERKPREREFEDASKGATAKPQQ